MAHKFLRSLDKALKPQQSLFIQKDLLWAFACPSPPQEISRVILTATARRRCS